jgi:hypothetical protein
VCQATIDRVQRDPSTGAVVPHKALLEWPVEQLKIRMTLEGVVLNNPATDAARNTALFGRPALRNIRSFDLARGTYDAPMSLQPASGTR